MAEGLKKGKVYLVGAGPGDPGLLTLKGKRCLEEAEVVIYDYLVDSRILAYAHPKAELIYVGKRGGGEAVTQEEINRLLLAKASAGKTVVRLKGGDPFLFGRGGEEAEEIAAAGIELEVVPGVTSAIAVPAYAGIPLTHRDYSSAVAIVTGHKEVWETSPRLNWDKLATACGTLVFLMGTRQLRNNMARLVSHGLSPETPVAVVRWGTKAEQEVLEGTVGTIADLAAAQHFQPPAVVVVGEVVRLRQRLKWFETEPLFGRRVVVTRAYDQAGVFAELLEQQGAEAIRFPTIETVPPQCYAPLDAAIRQIERYDWLIFTSVNGVIHFCQRLDAVGKDLRSLGAVRIAAIGPETAKAVKTLHLKVDAVPAEYQAEALLPVLDEVRGKKILLPRATGAREVLPQELRRRGATVDEVPAYRTVRPQERVEELRALLEEGRIDLVTFTSSSTVRNFVAMLGDGKTQELLGQTLIGCIGPVTADTVRSFGLKVGIQPKEYTIPAFAGAIVEHFRRLKADC
ncbi:MAG: uroporphyrinogen-III C-methyltransferase [Deltaproteobacteria bacterium]|nr:uroporphyrinogen-III C-methyltransferase [Deltaproteobacteria bacterium]